MKVYNVNIAVEKAINHKGLSFSASPVKDKELNEPVKHKMIVKPKNKKDKEDALNNKDKS
jgi:hypothetical protein